MATKETQAGTSKSGSPTKAVRRRRPLLVLVATRKGAWLYHGDGRRKSWRVEGPHFLGQIINHLVLDPRDGHTLLAAAKTGHLGPTIFRSTDLGRTWREAARPPAFAKAADGSGRAVDHSFWLSPCHANEPNVWYAGTSPQGLFRSEDGGDTWEPFSSINEDPQYRAWMGTVQDGTPDGPKLHSIIVDPRDPAHLYFAMSGGGVHESLDGQTFAPLLKGLEVVEGFDVADPTFHDPHCVRLCPSNPDRFYQQNHCGIYRLDRPGTEWVRIGRRMPKKVGDIGFPLVVHPRDADTLWVLPMDGQTVWPRTSPDGRPAVYVTRNGGKGWRRLDKGLPERHAWWTVKRQAMCADALDPVGLYFGTTSGELWMSRDEGDDWACIARHLPEIYAVEVAEAGVMKVLIPTPLFSYTQGAKVEASGATLAEVVSDLERQFPGIRFRMIDEQDRMRPHIRFFVNRQIVRELGEPLGEHDEVAIVQALSGGLSRETWRADSARGAQRAPGRA